MTVFEMWQLYLAHAASDSSGIFGQGQKQEKATENHAGNAALQQRQCFKTADPVLSGEAKEAANKTQE